MRLQCDLPGCCLSSAYLCLSSVPLVFRDVPIPSAGCPPSVTPSFLLMKSESCAPGFLPCADTGMLRPLLSCVSCLGTVTLTYITAVCYSC